MSNKCHNQLSLKKVIIFHIPLKISNIYKIKDKWMIILQVSNEIPLSLLLLLKVCLNLIYNLKMFLLHQFKINILLNSILWDNLLLDLDLNNKFLLHLIWCKIIILLKIQKWITPINNNLLLIYHQCDYYYNLYYVMYHLSLLSNWNNNS